MQINSSGINLVGQVERITGGNPKNLDIFAVTKDFIAALGTNTKTDISRSIDEFDELGNQVGGQIANLGIRQNLLEERLEIIEEKKLYTSNSSQILRILITQKRLLAFLQTCWHWKQRRIPLPR